MLRKSTFLGALFAIVLLIIAFSMAHANEIGVTVSQLHDDVNWGATANLSGTVSKDLKQV